jgi:segregation and condensation protein A
LIKVHLPKFEGPLDLLLYLIRKEEMDIFDIKIHEITHQYLEYIKLMKELDLEVAGDFISMASTLIHIKSRMLLPQYNEQGDLVENEDPRKELVERLIEYQKYQQASKLLAERPWVGRDIWLRGQREQIKPPEEEVILEENALFSLISCYRLVLRSFHKKIHKVTSKTQSIAQRILEIKAYLIKGQQVLMSSLITVVENRHRQVLITFLSLLELGKMGYVTLYQTETYGEIYIDTKNEVQTDVISRVEEFDGMKAQQAAEDLFAKTEQEKIAAEPLVDMDHINVLGLSEEDSEDVSFGAEEMASDEEILAAELELAAIETQNEEKVSGQTQSELFASQNDSTKNLESDLNTEFALNTETTLNTETAQNAQSEINIEPALNIEEEPNV